MPIPFPDATQRLSALSPPATGWATLHPVKNNPSQNSVFPILVLASHCGDDSNSWCLIGMCANDGFNNSFNSFLTANGLYAILFSLKLLTSRTSLVPSFIQDTILAHTLSNIRHAVVVSIIHCTSASLAHCHSYNFGIFGGNMDNYHYVFGQSHTSCSSSTRRAAQPICCLLMPPPPLAREPVSFSEFRDDNVHCRSCLRIACLGPNSGFFNQLDDGAPVTREARRLRVIRPVVAQPARTLPYPFPCAIPAAASLAQFPRRGKWAQEPTCPSPPPMLYSPNKKAR